MRVASREVSVSEIRRLVSVFDALVFTSLLWFMVQYLRYVFPPLFETIQLEYSVSNTEVGLIYSLLLFGYASMQFPGGYLSDRFNEWIVIIAGGLAFCVGLLLVFVSDPFWSLAVAMGLIGIGTGVHKTAAINLLSRLYPQKTGLSIGIMDSIGIFGGVLAPLTVVVVLDVAISWRLIFLAGTVVCLLVLYGFFASSEGEADSVSRAGVETDQAPSGRTYLRIFRQYHFVAFVVVSTSFTFAWTGVTAFYPLYLSTVGGLGSGTAGVLYGVLFALSLGQTATGALSDLYDAVNLVFVLFVLMSLSLLAVLLSSTLVAFAAATVLMGIGFHGFRPVRDAYLMRMIPSDIGGGVLGIVRTVMLLVGAAAPAALGVTADTVGLVSAFALLLGVTIVGTLFIVSMRFVPMPPEEELPG